MPRLPQSIRARIDLEKELLQLLLLKERLASGHNQATWRALYHPFCDRQDFFRMKLVPQIEARLVPSVRRIAKGTGQVAVPQTEKGSRRAHTDALTLE